MYHRTLLRDHSATDFIFGFRAIYNGLRDSTRDKEELQSQESVNRELVVLWRIIRMVILVTELKVKYFNEEVTIVSNNVSCF